MTLYSDTVFIQYDIFSVSVLDLDTNCTVWCAVQDPTNWSTNYKGPYNWSRKSGQL